ncbi:MAG: hemin uptake protein HemP [Pseudohongiellaceae bacterium]
MKQDPAQQSRNHGTPVEIDSAELLGDRKELGIIHNGERYQLRITANNKLILTK